MIGSSRVDLQICMIQYMKVCVTQQTYIIHPSEKIHMCHAAPFVACDKVEGDPLRCPLSIRVLSMSSIKDW